MTIIQNAEKFTSSGIHIEGIKVTDTNLTPIVLSGSASETTLEIASSGKVLLEGEYNAINVTTAGVDVMVNGSVGTFYVEPEAAEGTKIKLSPSASIKQYNVPDEVQKFENYDFIPPTITLAEWNDRRGELTLTFSEVVDVAPSAYPTVSFSGGWLGGDITYDTIDKAISNTTTLTLKTPIPQDISYLSIVYIQDFLVTDKAGYELVLPEDYNITVIPQ